MKSAGDSREPLTEAQFGSMRRLAAHSARTERAATPLLSPSDRYEAALDAIVQHVADHGWPGGDIRPLFRAASNGIQRAGYEAAKHRARAFYWHEPPGANDSLAEAITDKIAIWQVCWALSPGEWRAVWCVAEAMLHGGNLADAAELAGIPVHVLKERLASARRRGRELWVAPGDHAMPMYHSRRSRLDVWHQVRRRAERRLAG